MAKKKNYLNNADLSEAIHKSKMTYCDYESLEHTKYDHIICDEYDQIDFRTVIKSGLDVLTPEYIEEVKEELCRKKNLGRISRNRSKPENEQEQEWFPNMIPTNTIIFKLMTWDHIPSTNGPEREVRITKHTTVGRVKKHFHKPIPFPPFQHVIISDDGEVKVVLKSHHKDGEFSPDHGRMSNELGKMYMLLCQKIGNKGNYKGYTYLEDMRGTALTQLCQVGLQFDESRQAYLNPFAWATTVINNSFKKILNKEKKVRELRDNMLEAAGQQGSYSRQFENEKKAYDSYQDSSSTTI